MDTRKFLSFGALGALACVGACAAAAFLPALLATGGFALVSSAFIGWPLAIGLALIATAGLLFWRARERRQVQRACAAPETTP
ncbi:MAG: hypothetical protein ACK4X1_07270 [Terricaulis sp.]